MRLKIPVIVTTVCILALTTSCRSKNEPGHAETALQHPTTQDSLDKNSRDDTPTPENHSRDMHAPQHNAAAASADYPEKAKIPERPQPASKPVSAPNSNPAGSPPAVFANETDYICGMEVMPDYTDTCRHNGKVYAFCSEYCKDKFKENPEKHLEKK